MIDYPLNFSNKLVDLLESKALLASDVVNFILNTSHLGLGKSIILIGCSSGLPEISEGSQFKRG